MQLSPHLRLLINTFMEVLRLKLWAKFPDDTTQANFDEGSNTRDGTFHVLLSYSSAEKRWSGTLLTRSCWSVEIVAFPAFLNEVLPFLQIGRILWSVKLWILNFVGVYIQYNSPCLLQTKIQVHSSVRKHADVISAAVGFEKDLIVHWSPKYGAGKHMEGHQ